MKRMTFAALLFPLALVAAPQAKLATNTLCPVTGEKVDAKSKVVAVRGHQYRVCCADCPPKLQATPDKYLEKDGTPKNAPKHTPMRPTGH